MIKAARILGFSILLYAASSFPALAQNKEVSESDKAIFAFFKLTNTTPDYDQWIRNSGKYLAETDPAARESLYEIESLRLKWGFGTHNLDNDFIRIRTPVKLALTGDERKGNLSFIFPDAHNSVPYFPFAYGREWIALIVGDIERFLTVPLTPEEFAFIRKLFTPNAAYDGEILLRIKPMKADASQPLPLDGLEQWLMMGETGYLELIYKPAGEEIVLWSYMAPWYLSDTEKSLYPLLDK